jgi:hypothetical protein
MNSPQAISFDRLFQIWTYVVSHSQLLLRSVKTQEAKSRIDILFKNVGLVCLTASLDNIAVEQVSPSVVGLTGTEPFLKGRTVFQVKSSNYTGYVVAGAVACHEDQGEYHEPSSLLPAQ